MAKLFLSQKQQVAIRHEAVISAPQHRLRAHRLCLALMTSLAGCAPLAAWADTGARTEVWVTTDDHRLTLAHDELPARTERNATRGAQTIIHIEADRRYQSIVGFGASVTDSSAWLLRHRMDAAQRAALLHELFGREGEGIGFDFARLTIGASDFSLNHYSHDTPPTGHADPELRHFAIDPAQDDVGPVMQQVLAINPNLALMASPWSAPAWMKDSGQLVKGRLLPQYHEAFARYLLAYVDARAAQGIPIFALTVQNEPDYEPDDYPGMRFNAPERTRFIGSHLGPLRDARAPSLQIFDWDHNWDKQQEPLAVLADPTASRHVSAVAWHCYGGNVAAQTAVREAHPDKDVYMTECSSGTWEPIRSGGLPLQARTVIDAIRHWARGVLFWNLALDENHGPHAGGCGTCFGVVTIDSKTGAVTRTNDYYALAHASRFVRRDAWRIGSTYSRHGIDNVAFENADDGSRVLLVSNSNNASHTLAVRDGERSFRYVLPARSVATFRWPGTDVHASDPQ